MKTPIQLRAVDTLIVDNSLAAWFGDEVTLMLKRSGDQGPFRLKVKEAIALRDWLIAALAEVQP